MHIIEGNFVYGKQAALKVVEVDEVAVVGRHFNTVFVNFVHAWHTAARRRLASCRYDR